MSESVNTDRDVRDARGRLGGIDQLRIRHRLDDCCVTELRRLVDAYLGWVAAGPSGRDDVAAGWRADHLFAAADHGAVATAFADFLAETSTGARETVDAFAGSLAAADGVLEPFAQYVRAVSALTDADPAGALAVLGAMIDAGAAYAPAADLAAVLLADAGRPVDALAARRRATSLGWQPADTATLTSLLRLDAKTGRNDPCPCGSGRKYKQCCQREPKVTTADRRRLAVHQTVRYAVHGSGRDELWSLVMTAMTEAMRPGDDPADVIGSIMLDPIMIDIATFETGAAEAYLHERGNIVPPEERAWLERLAATPLALWACERNADGTYRARNVMTDERLEGVRFPNVDDGDAALYVLGRMMADGADGEPGAVGPSLVVDQSHAPALVELLDGFGEAHEWARWVGRRMGGVDVRMDAEPAINRGFFALPDGGWDTARPMLDSLLTVDGDGWTQSVELADRTLVRARVTADGDELVVATSSLRRLGDLRDVLDAHGMRILRSEVPDPDDDDDDEWDGPDDAWDEDWDDDDPDDDPGDPEALAAALRAIDAMFDRTSERSSPDASPA